MGDARATIEVRVQPGARSSELVRLESGVLYARVKAPPRKGEANRALIGLIARALSVPGNTVDIIRGHAGRNKVIAVKGLDAAEVKERLGHILIEKRRLL